MKKILIISTLLFIALTSNAQNKLSAVRVNNNIFHATDSVMVEAWLKAKHPNGTWEWSTVQSPSPILRMAGQRQYIDKDSLLSAIHLYNLVPGMYILSCRWTESGENLSNEQHMFHIRADFKEVMDTVNIIP